MGDGATPEPTTQVEWRYGVDDSRVLAVLSYVFPGVLGGVGLLVVGLAGWVVVESLRVGDVGRAVALIVVALLALLARRGVAAALSTRSVLDPLRDRYSGRGLLAASVLGAAVLLASARLDSLAPFVLFVLSWVPLGITAEFPTEGVADPTAGTLVVNEETIPLAALRGYRAYRVGPLVVCPLSYARGVPTAPRFVVVPGGSFDAVESVLVDAAAAPAEGHSTLGRAERAIVAAVGLCLVAVGPVLLVVLPPGDGKLLAVYAGLLFGVFGVISLWYATAA
jgi:hypothetical protein